MPYAVLDTAGTVLNCLAEDDAELTTIEISAAKALEMSAYGRFDVFKNDGGTIVFDSNLAAAVARQSMTCGPLEMRRALRATGDYASVVAYIATADEDTQEAWEYATVFKRLDPMVLGVQQLLGKTDAEVDALFELAKTLG